MSIQFHNPEKLEPEAFGAEDGFRMLTVEEAAVLSDPLSARTMAGLQLKERLGLQMYFQTACRWGNVVREGRFAEGVSYRTAAPLPNPLDEFEAELSLTALHINNAVGLCHNQAVAAGWHTDPETGLPIYEAAGRWAKYVIGTRLALIHSEVSEGLEGQRKGLNDDKLPHRRMLEVELADAVIRIFDLAGSLGYDLGGAIAEKIHFNASRPDHKPANRAEEGGKKF